MRQTINTSDDIVESMSASIESTKVESLGAGTGFSTEILVPATDCFTVLVGEEERNLHHHE